MGERAACALKAAESASQATRLAQENAVLAGELQRAREANRAGGLQLGSAQEALAAARAEAQEATGWGAALEKELAELKADRDHEEMHTLEYTNKVVDIVKQAKETTRQRDERRLREAVARARSWGQHCFNMFVSVGGSNRS